MSQLDVLLVAFHYPPEISGGVPRALIIEDYLARAGCRVRVMTPQPIEKGCRGGEIVHVPLPRYMARKPSGEAAPSDEATLPNRRKSDTLLRRFAKRWVLVPDPFVHWSIRAARRALELARRQPVDLVITSSPPDSMHWIGRCLRRRLGCSWLADFRDGWTYESHHAEAMLPGRRLVERRLERCVLDGADWITAATRPIVEDFQSRYPRRRRHVHFLPTGFEPPPFEPPVQDDEKLQMVYTGRFGLSRKSSTASTFFAGLRKAIEASPHFAQQFRLTLVGSYDQQERALWSSPPVSEYVRQLGPVPYEEALRLSAGATMLLLATMTGQRSVATRKLFDYLAVRRPVFALAEDNEAARILKETRAGLCVPPDDSEAVAAGLLRVFEMWRAGTLAQEIPCSGNDLYLAEPHFTRVLGDVILAEKFAQQR